MNGKSLRSPIEAIAELSKHISVMDIASSTILAIRTGTCKSVALQELEAVPKLTLFPRVSKTSKANFGYRLTIFREHFFKHRFFKDDKLVILTLMKGDEVVKVGEEQEPISPALYNAEERIPWSHCTRFLPKSVIPAGLIPVSSS